MKKIATSALLVLLCITFVMGVYCYGTDQRYSLWQHFRHIVNEFQSFPSVLELADIWTKTHLGTPPIAKTEVETMYNDGVIDQDLYFHYLKDHSGEPFTIMGNPVQSVPCYDETCMFYTGDDYVILVPDKTDNPIVDAFNGVRSFFNRLGATIGWVIDFVVGFFKVVGALLPWNGLKSREEPPFILT